MLLPTEQPDTKITYGLVATLHPRAVAALSDRGISLRPETEHDAAGPTSYAYVTSDNDEFLLVFHPDAPVPGIDVLAPSTDIEAVAGLVANLGGEPGLVTWRADED